MSQALLSSAYFGPIQWYQKLYRYDRVRVEAYDNFIKQTYRNRCVIATTGGVQALTVPVERTGAALAADGKATAGKCLMRDIRISDHGNWRHLHWNALASAYGESPFSSITLTTCGRSSSGSGPSCMTSTWRFAPKCAN